MSLIKIKTVEQPSSLLLLKIKADAICVRTINTGMIVPALANAIRLCVLSYRFKIQLPVNAGKYAFKT